MALSELEKQYSVDFVQRFPRLVDLARTRKWDTAVANLDALPTQKWLHGVEGKHDFTTRRSVSLALGAAALHRRLATGIDTQHLVPAAVRMDYLGGVPCAHLYVELLPYGFTVVEQDEQGPRAVGASFWVGREQFDAGLALYDYSTERLYPLGAERQTNAGSCGVVLGTIMPRPRKLV